MNSIPGNFYSLQETNFAWIILLSVVGAFVECKYFYISNLQIQYTFVLHNIWNVKNLNSIWGQYLLMTFMT